MYKSNSLWDQEQERYEATGSPGQGYHGADYHSGEKYQENPGEEYQKDEAAEVRTEKSDFEKTVDDNIPKYEKKEQGIVIEKAAAEIRQEMEQETEKVNKNSSSIRSIEEAINKAMKEQKEVVRL